MLDYIDSYEIIYSEVTKCAQEIEDKSQELASLMLKLHEVS